MAAETTTDRTPLTLPARLLELVGQAAGCELSPESARSSAALGRVTPRLGRGPAQVPFVRAPASSLRKPSFELGQDGRALDCTAGNT